ncbi:hypothetical protein [Planktotalea sp.]|uniref:hypothetical protein n=1 Tax=Planktotalea sp. TaxID=2029877 RepID=UPI003D6B47B3
MKQSANLTRWKRLASLLGARLNFSASNPSHAQSAALALRQSSFSAPAEGVTFIVPLVSKDQVQDWDTVCDKLNGTLESFVQQSNPNWKALVIGQTKPQTLNEDPRITFLPFTQPVEGNDKWVKLKFGCGALPDHGWQSGYAMSFDADDLAHESLVEEVLKQQRSGYLVTDGYLFDATTKEIARTGKQSLLHPHRKPFWKLCGSCAVWRYDLGNGNGEIEFLQETLQHEHRMFPYFAKLAKRGLTPLGFPAALYLINHGDNFSERRGRGGFKTRLVEKYAISDAEQKREALQPFPDL